MVDSELQNKVGIVTGGGSGLGAAAALKLGQHGVRVAVNDMNPDRAERVAHVIREAGGQAIAIGADVANKFQCVHLVETTRAEWGQLDILINHAAVKPRSSIIKCDEWDWQRCLDVNLKGTFFMCQLVGRVMADENLERGGRLINLSGPAGLLTAWEGRAAVCAAQAAIVGFTRECAREYADFGVTVNVLLSEKNGGEATALQSETTVDQWPAELNADYQRLLTDNATAVEQNAALILALCRPAASGVNGMVLAVDADPIMG